MRNKKIQHCPLKSGRSSTSTEGVGAPSFYTKLIGATHTPTNVVCDDKTKPKAGGAFGAIGSDIVSRGAGTNYTPSTTAGGDVYGRESSTELASSTPPR